LISRQNAATTERRSVPHAGRWTVGLLIISPAASPALRLWADNVAQVPSGDKLLLIVGGYVLLGFAIFWLIRLRIGDARVGAFVTFLTLLALTSSGQVLASRPWPLRWLGALVAVSVAAAIVLRLRDWWVLDAVVLGCAAALLVPSILTGAWSGISNTKSEVSPLVQASLPMMTSHPDIVLVIVDGYTSLPVVRELFGYEDPALVADLDRVGFETLETAFSPYSTTHLTLSSLLELDYVAKTRPSTTTEDGRTLARVMSGDNFLVGLLAENGYRVTMVEPGWHMSTCGDPIDVCVPAPFIDEGVGVVLSQSLLWSLIEPSVGSAFTQGSRQAMTWATDNIGSLVDDDQPDFVFVHVLAPHPPLFLDAACQVVDARRRLLGAEVGLARVDAETARVRVEGYVSQVECVNDFIRDLATAADGSESLVFIAGDHGSDSMSQPVTATEQWSEPQILERMSVFLAVKAPTRCEGIPSLVTVPLFRSLVACVGDLDLEPVEEKAFLVSQAEVDRRRPDMRVLDAGQLGRLAACLPVVDENLECG
jgi:hypothetical protein